MERERWWHSPGGAGARWLQDTETAEARGNISLEAPQEVCEQRWQSGENSPPDVNSAPCSLLHLVPGAGSFLQPSQLISSGFTSPLRLPGASAYLDGHKACQGSAAPFPRPLQGRPWENNPQCGWDKLYVQKKRSILNKDSEMPSSCPDLRVVLTVLHVNLEFSVLGGSPLPRDRSLSWHVSCYGQRSSITLGTGARWKSRKVCCSGLAQCGEADNLPAHSLPPLHAFPLHQVGP